MKCKKAKELLNRLGVTGEKVMPWHEYKQRAAMAYYRALRPYWSFSDCFGLADSLDYAYEDAVKDKDFDPEGDVAEELSCWSN